MSGSALGRSGSSCSMLTLPSSVVPLRRNAGWARQGWGKAPGRAPAARRAPHLGTAPAALPGGGTHRSPPALNPWIPESMNPQIPESMDP